MESTRLDVNIMSLGEGVNKRCGGIDPGCVVWSSNYDCKFCYHDNDNGDDKTLYPASCMVSVGGVMQDFDSAAAAAPDI